MRHSFASQLVMAGVPIKFVSELLGHSQTKITERYAHLSPESVQSFIGVLDGENVPTPAVRNLPGWMKGE